MEDNEFRLKATLEASENEIRDIAEFFTGKIRETQNELVAVRKFSKNYYSRNINLISYEKKVVEHLKVMKLKRKMLKLMLMMNK